MINFIILKLFIFNFVDVIGLFTKIIPIESRTTKKKITSEMREIEILMPE